MNDKSQIYQQLSEQILKDKSFKERFLSEPKPILTEMGVKIPASVRVEVHEDTANLRNFVIPENLPEEDRATASNPLFRKAIAKADEDRNFKTQLRQNPKSALAEFTGESLPEDLEICVHENSPTLLHLVISVDSAEEDLSDRELETVVGGRRGIRVLLENTLGLRYY